MLPERVRYLSDRAAAAGFAQSSDVGVGQLLAALAASVPLGGRVLELGTGVGIGTAWLVDGLGDREDVEVVSVDVDPAVIEHAQTAEWPPTVRFVVGDALEVLPSLGSFNLVFADAIAGKWYGLDRTMRVVRPGGYLVVDDMTPPYFVDGEHETKTNEVRMAILNEATFVSVELAIATGVILATKRFDLD